MKKLSLLCAALLLSMGLHAQKKGLLGKLADKIDEVAATASGVGTSGPNEKDLKKDIESTELDGKPILKDSRNLSGIYYSQVPVRVGRIFEGKAKWAQKFLVNYEEGDNHFIEFTSRYSLDPKAEIPSLVFGPRPGTPDYFPVTTSKKIGNLLIDGITDKKNGADGMFFYGVASHVFDFKKPEGQWIKQSLNVFNLPYLLELEPGMLVAFEMSWLIAADTPEKYKFLLENAPYVLFYKKEKENEAKALSKEVVFERMKKFFTQYYALYKAAEGNNVQLAKPIGKFKDEPSNADLVAAAKDRMKKMPYYTEELVYLYPVTSWENRFENVGIMGRTLTHRVMQVQAVLKQGDTYKMTQFLIRQDNAYSAGSSVERFSGQPVVAIGDIEKQVINAPNALKYKK